MMYIRQYNSICCIQLWNFGWYVQYIMMYIRTGLCIKRLSCQWYTNSFRTPPGRVGSFTLARPHGTLSYGYDASHFSGKMECSLVHILEWENETFLPAQLFTQTYSLFNSSQASQGDPLLLVCAYELENS
jgi:hypothetical protein